MTPDGAGKAQGIRKDAWKAASLRSTFGTQCLGGMESAQACGFGSSVRDAGNKLYMSQEADKSLVSGAGGNQSQGAIYKVPEALGKQVLSNRPSSAQPRFGTSKRSSMAMKTDSPGPGAYKFKSSLGSSVQTPTPTAPRMRFGNAQRGAADKIFISAQHEKSSVGRDSPGPLAYNSIGHLGKQELSEWETAPGWKLGTGSRFGNVEERRAAEVPGPGQYAVPRAFGPQVASNKRSLPVVGFGKAGAKLARPQTAPAATLAAQVSLLGITKQSSKDSIPEYNLSTVQHPPSWRFGTGKRLPITNSDTPGPGEYYA